MFNRSTSPGQSFSSSWIVTKLPEALRHLLAFDLEEAVVHPDFRERMAVMGAFALGDFVFVMGKHQIDAAAMDVEGLAE